MNWIHTCTDEEFELLRESRAFEKAYEAGYYAYKTSKECPYPKDSPQEWAWYEGKQIAQGH